MQTDNDLMCGNGYLSNCNLFKSFSLKLTASGQRTGVINLFLFFVPW